MKRLVTMSALGLAAVSAAAAAARAPSAEHAVLVRLAGEYTLTARFRPAPGDEPIVSHLPARRSLILDGRVLWLEVGPDSWGFRGTGLMGYDVAERRFWYVWTDTSTTGIASLQGSLELDGAGRFEGTRPTPEGPTPLRVEIRREGRGEAHDYFVPAGRGDEHRYLELRYEPVE